VAFRPFDRPAPVALRGGDRLLFSVNLQIELTAASDGTPASRIAAYRYHILDRDEREILAYHWHPEGASSVRFPHLHLSSAIGPMPLPHGGVVALDQMHLPTGIVPLGDVVRLLLVEFGVTPRRKDWEAVLDRLEDRGVAGLIWRS
jgi:hypothetical protein